MAIPVTARLLDPPLHEYLPRDHNAIQHVCDDLGITEAKLTAIMKTMRE